MYRYLVPLLCLCIAPIVAPLAATAANISIDTVPVGNAGNAADPSTGSLYGSVGYAYRIGATEVTNAQYAAFLNAKAASDPLALYNSNMGSDAGGGITRSGISGSYTYALKPNMADKPVNFVSWYDAIRFANWLNNGQGSGNTETGAYTLLGGTPVPTNGLSITRNPGGTWYLPSENEWYKSAYHQPTTQGGDSDNYWLYPTASNTAPTIAADDSVGDISNPGVNVANYSAGANWNGQVGALTTVGSAGPFSKSYYGTSDQGGNVFEWNDTLINNSYRGLRGGSSFNNGTFLQSSFRSVVNQSFEDRLYGFRVATVPEPSSLALCIFGIVGLAVIWWQRTRSTS